MRVEQAKPGRLIIQKREERIKTRVVAEPVTPQVLLGSEHRIGRPLVSCQLADEPQEERRIVGCSKSDPHRAPFRQGQD